MTIEYYDKDVRREITKRLEGDKKPWHDYKLIRKGVTMEPRVYINRVQEIAKFNLKFAAFCSILYLTGARLCEILKYKYAGKYSDVKEQTGTLYKPAIQVSDIKLEVDEERKVTWLVITTRVEKKKEERTAFRQSYILYDKYYSDGTPNYLYPLIQILESYLDQYFSNVAPETQLFAYSDTYIQKYVMKWLHLTPHAIRGMRAKHLVRYHNFDVTALKTFFNWSDATIAVEYAASEVKDIKRRLLGEII